MLPVRDLSEAMHTWHQTVQWFNLPRGVRSRGGVLCIRAGVVGIGLAMAGARVTLTDLPHITPLTAQNLALNADKQSLDAQASSHAAMTLQSGLQNGSCTGVRCSHAQQGSEAMELEGAVEFDTWLLACDELLWHSKRSRSALAQVVPYAWGEDAGRLPQGPDVITGADVVYEQEYFPALISSLRMLAAPHTVIYLSYRLRGTQHGSLQGV